MADLLKILIFLTGSAALGFILGRRSRNSDVAIREHQADEQRRAFVEIKGRLDRCTSKRAGLERELAQVKKGKSAENQLKATKKPPVTKPKKQDAPKSKAPNLSPPKQKETKAKPPKVSAKTKQEEALERVKANAQQIDFDRIGRASKAEKDDLKKIKGVGPFLEKKLNALGIYTFAQIANFTDDDKEQVNQAIEFFPGRISRDNWVGQAKDLQQNA
ncbi:hypothetical protein [Tunicatimonas pelagia]|uniref:hypothetical protein n=1 Tax=Tunicatimonas pelagia TaxID=931531 RepID=UPI0026664C0E|nr:hypothetical protein [Tunicatimonas pelagia]WKN42193.1 hypothetical protein P0M28_24455 [Tunicatimonas pelagia]